MWCQFYLLPSHHSNVLVKSLNFVCHILSHNTHPNELNFNLQMVGRNIKCVNGKCLVTFTVEKVVNE
jgi:hypothetical protein